MKNWDRNAGRAARKRVVVGGMVAHNLSVPDSQSVGTNSCSEGGDGFTMRRDGIVIEEQLGDMDRLKSFPRTVEWG